MKFTEARDILATEGLPTWTDADEREYIAWLNRDLAQLSAAFLDAKNDLFDEWCRDKFDEDRALAQGDMELDAEKEQP